jgi:hypothetical protein
MIKLIFLDIDGVLNSVDSSTAANALKLHRLEDFDKVRFGLLKWLCDQTDAQIVISSTWRIGRTPDWFIGYFEAQGCWRYAPVVGMTPRGGGFRGKEVNEYLETNGFRPETCKHVIFDDDSDFFDDQPFIHVDRITGLTLRHVYRAIDILGLGKEADESVVEGLRAHVEFERKATNG